MKYKFHPAPFLCLVAYSALESASCPELTVVLMLCSPNAYYLRRYIVMLLECIIAAS